MATTKKLIAVFATLGLAISVTGFAFASDDILQSPTTNRIEQDMLADSTAGSSDENIEVLLADDAALINKEDPEPASEALPQNEVEGEASLFADPIDAEVAIRGTVWNDENRNGYMDDGDSAGIQGVRVNLYSGLIFASEWEVVGTAVTNNDGSYVFVDNKGDEIFFSKDEAYYVEFDNTTLAATTQFSQGYPESLDPMVSHFARLAGDDPSVGVSERFFGSDIEQSGVCTINAGICVLPTLSYAAGADDGSVSGIPAVESVRSGTRYTVQGSSPIPTREGYTFAGWVVSEGAFADPEKPTSATPAIGNEYNAGDWFYMSLADVVLTATWNKQPVPTLSGYTGVYDGSTHGVSVTDGSGNPWLVEGDTVKYFTSEGTGALVESDNEFVDVTDTEVSVVIERSHESGTEVIFEGTARVTINPLPVVVKTKSNTRVYNGAPLTAAVEVQVGAAPSNEYSNTSNTVSLLTNNYANEKGSISVTGSQRNAGHSANTCSELSFLSESGAKASNYTVTYEKPGTLTVIPARLIVSIQSASKVYDGKPLNHTAGAIHGIIPSEADKVKIIVTGSQTEVGTVKMAYTIDWGDVVKENYVIGEEYVGSLVVKHSADEVAVITGGVFTYDGQVHAPKVEVLFGESATANVLPQGYTLVEASSNARAKDATSSPIEAVCDTLIITNVGGTDVTDTLNIRYYNGTLTIKQAPIYVVTQSATKSYDGEALTAGGSISGFIAGETATFAVTGAQTSVGSSTNTYSLKWTNVNTKESNYQVFENLGTLRVESVPLGATSPNGTPGGTTSNVSNSSGNAVIDAMANVAGAVTGRDVTVTVTPEKEITENETPVTSGDALYAWDWAAFYTGVGIAITAIYLTGVTIRRSRHTASLGTYEDEIYGIGESSASDRLNRVAP